MKLFSAIASLAVLAGVVFSPLVHAAGMDGMMPKQAEKATSSDMKMKGTTLDASGKPFLGQKASSSRLGTVRSKTLAMVKGDCDVVGNQHSKIYHMAGSAAATKMTHIECFKTEAAAQSAGYRKAKNAK